MNFKLFTGCVAGFFLLPAAAMAEPDNKGVINTLDVTRGHISIDYRNMRLTDSTRIRSAEGRNQDKDDLAPRQHVSYSVNASGDITEIHIYDPRKLKEQRFYTGNELNH